MTDHDPEKNFEELWHTFNDRYPFFELRGVDWDKQYAEYRPQVTKETDEAALFDILCRMLAPLNDGHVGLDAGKSADEVGKIADAVCQQRLVNAPQRGQAAVEAKLHCFLSEGTARFCTGSQARKATADIINYFKGIEYTNKAMVMAANMPFRSSSGDNAQPSTSLTPDPRVADAIEGLMRAGYLNRGHREDIGANVPRAYKERFARVVGIKSPCPAPPWWAVWK